MESGRPVLHTFDLTGEDEAELGWGLGCNGIIDVLIEPTPNAAVLAEELRAVATDRTSRALVTLLEGERAGARQSLDANGVVRRPLGPELEPAATEAARQTLVDERPAIRQLGSGVRAFVELVRPPLRLLICGDRTDAGPLAAAAADVGIEITRVGRRDLPSPEHLDGRTFAIVMNHHYATDREHLRALLASPVPYLGVLGPRARTDRLLADLGVSGEELPRVFAPAGLDIGAEGPHEVAHSIVAEIVAVERGRRGGPLRDRIASIHADAAAGIRE
jgi:xanthine/CO dehydrogenase XdhC/CoxF family maturation factor